MYEFYLRTVPPRTGDEPRSMRAVRFAWALFRAFLLKLTPARRFVYAVSLIAFAVGYAQDLSLYVWMSFGAVSFLLAMEVADKLLTRDDLALARGIQESLHPSEDLAPEGYQVAAHSEVAREVGGDFYDVLQLTDGTVLAAIGDVSGKGIASALYAVKAQTALQLFAEEDREPDRLLGRLNRHLYRNMRRGYFLPVALARLHPDGRVQFCRAGHPPALVFHPGTGMFDQIQSRGVAIGMAPGSGAPRANGDERSFEDLSELVEARLDVGDVMILYSDGLVESTDPSGREFGIDRLAAVLRAFHSESLQSLRDRIVSTVLSFRDGTDLRDDTTVLMFRRNT